MNRCIQDPVYYRIYPSRHTTSFQRLYDVYTTSATSYRRRIDVETTSCVYWDTTSYYVFELEKLASLLASNRRFSKYLLTQHIEIIYDSSDWKILTTLIIIYRFTRVVFGLTSSPLLLNGTLQVHLLKYLCLEELTTYVEKLMDNLYVDDSTNSFDIVQDCIAFFEISKKCLSDANYILRNWNTNDPQKIL